MKVIKTLVSFCTKPFVLLKPKKRVGAKKYIVTDAGGGGKLDNPCHYYYLDIIPIRGETSCVMVVFDSTLINRPEYTLEKLGTILPQDIYLNLFRTLTRAQAQREMIRILSRTDWNTERYK